MYTRTSTLTAQRAPEVWELIAELRRTSKACSAGALTEQPARIIELACAAEDAIHNLLGLLAPCAYYEDEIAEKASLAAHVAVNHLTSALERVADRFRETGGWICNGLQAYQTVLETLVMARGLRSQRLGLRDPARRVPEPAFGYDD